ncbi:MULTISPECIES: S8 family peptidase [Streptosporangium]|uniref:Subtilisin family serine protease n=1 Tax=Streptosporangium brasiliense TaxID=47480 RepID=A0ABT9R821_9ACTN|nr:S8 family serine peptidase [Streptosporangium brasiliense]MDP9865382.1 subtilisin family serine protease [Streptosporangium brasiliense]
MRLRALVALAIVLTVAPGVPALAEEAPAPPPAAAQDSPAPAAETPPPGGEAPPPDEGTPVPPPAEQPPAPKLEPGLAADGDGARVIVEVTAPAEAAPVAGEARTLSGTEVVLQPPDTSFIVVEGTGESLAALADDPRVVSVRRDRTYSPSDLGTGLSVIGADQAHAAGFTGKGQMIAVIDTGIDRDHPALHGRVVEEACFSATDDGAKSLCPGGSDTQIGTGSADAETAMCVKDSVNLCDHGTHVAGIASAVAPDADIMAIQVFSRIDDAESCGEESCLTAYESSILLALDHVARSTRDIAAVNLSLGGGLFNGACDAEPALQEMKERIEALRAKGVATVAAAGNEYETGAGAPGCISSAVTVGATDGGDVIPDWSNRGSILDLFAPGVDIDSSVPGGGRQVYSGTSMATPHVAGAFALLTQKSAEATPDALLEQLRKAGRPIVYDGVTTPRLDVYGALTDRAPSPPATQSPGSGDPTPDDPDDGSDDDPSPDPSSGPVPAPGPADPPAPSPVPLPTVTVTVTVTASPATAPAVCTRGKATKTLTAAGWATEMTRGKGTLTDETLGCYLRLVAKASDVFPELTRASTPGAAYRVLKPAKKTKLTKKVKLESELLAAWLNWAHGGVNFTAKVNGSTTVKEALASAERQRLKGTSSAAYTSMLKKQVNERRIA